jgi:multidrug efflux pump subunit AcrB
VSFGREKRDAIIRQNGRPTIVMGMLRRTGANVVDVMRDLKREIAAVNETVFAGRGVRLVQVIHVTGPESLDEAREVAAHVDAILLEHSCQGRHAPRSCPFGHCSRPARARRAIR